MRPQSDRLDSTNPLLSPAEGLIVTQIINWSGVMAVLIGVVLPLLSGIVGGWDFWRTVSYTAAGLLYLGLVLSYLLSPAAAGRLYHVIHPYLFLCGVAAFGLTIISAEPYLQPLVFTVPFVFGVLATSPRMAALIGGSYVAAIGLALLIAGLPPQTIMITVAVYAPIFLFMFGMIRLAVDQANAHREAARLAAENARLAAENAVVATLAERNRIARELHDTIAQGLTAVTMQIEAAQRALHRDPERTATRLSRAHELARQTLADVRRSVWALAEQALDSAGLVAALETLTQDLQARSGIRAELRRYDLPTELSPEQNNQILRIVQESLANVERHSQAAQVEIGIRRNTAMLELWVRDDGIGFEPQAAGPRDDGGGFGLSSLRERARLAGGHLHIESSPGAGTTILVQIANRSLERQP